MAGNKPTYHPLFNGYSTGVQGIMISLSNPGFAELIASPGQHWGRDSQGLAKDRIREVHRLAGLQGFSTLRSLGASLPKKDADDLKTHPILVEMMSFLKNNASLIRQSHP